ncbi:MAG: FUSC family protein [Parachlamydiaceae bacterium]
MESEFRVGRLSWPRRLVRKILSITELALAFKTGLAASLSLIAGSAFATAFDRPDIFISGLWSVMASIVVMQTHVGGTYGAAWIRLVGVLLGSISGAVFIYFFGSGPFVLAAAVFSTLVLCSLLNLKESFRIAGMSTAIVIVVGGTHVGVDPWWFGFYRFIDSCIGIIIAVLISRIVWPEKATENIRLNIGKVLNLLSKYYLGSTKLELSSGGYIESTESLFNEIEDLLQQNREYQKESELELFDNRVKYEHWVVISDQLEVVFSAITALSVIRKDTLSKIFDDALAGQVANVVDKTNAAFQVLEKSIIDIGQPSSLDGLKVSLNALNEELLRFRGTRTTRQFNLEDVESFFVFFYSLRSIGEAILKIDLLHN